MRTNGLLWLGVWLAVASGLGVVGCGSRDKGGVDTPDGRSTQETQAVDDAKTASGLLRAAPGDPDHPGVRIETSLGAITVKLDAQAAPLTVDNFLEYVDAGHYDGTIFHQVHPGRAVLGGAYTPEMIEKPSRVPVRNEAHNGLTNRRGTIAMARRPDVIDSATSQFFINLAANPELDHRDRTADGYGYCVFGEVTEGMDVVDLIGSVALGEVALPDGETLPSAPLETVLIKSIRRARP